MMLASTQETSLIKKVNSILIQANKLLKEELLFHFSMSLYMQASMPERHRGLYIG
jgi:hypothetical protein